MTDKHIEHARKDIDALVGMWTKRALRAMGTNTDAYITFDTLADELSLWAERLDEMVENHNDETAESLYLDYHKG